MRNRRSLIIAVARSAAAALAFVFVAVAPPASPSALAGALDDAKSAGYVGERPDGYLGLVDPGAPASVRKLVDDVNAKRRDRYAEIAQRTGSNVRAVGILAGEKLIAGATPGTFVMDSSGRWQRK